MSYTSWQVKQRYNQANYSRTGILLPLELKEAFKEKCAKDGTSMAAVIREIMEEYNEKHEL